MGWTVSDPVRTTLRQRLRAGAPHATAVLAGLAVLAVNYVFPDWVFGWRAMVWAVALMWAPFVGAGLWLWFRSDGGGVASRGILGIYAIWAGVGTLAVVAEVLLGRGDVGRWAFTVLVLLSVVVPVLVPMLRMLTTIRSPGVE